MCFCPTKVPFIVQRCLALRGYRKHRNSFSLMSEKKNRTKKIDARFTEDEYKIVEQMEKTLGLRKTDLVRIRLLSNSAALVINAKEFITEINSISLELHRNGKNINQMARHANSLKLQGRLEPDVIGHFLRLMETHTKNQEMLEVTLRKMMRSLIH
jgi:hypothetical protein